MRKFLFGFATYFVGLKLWVSHRSLLKLSVIPFFLDLVCLIFGIYFTVTHFSQIAAQFVHRSGSTFGWLFYYLKLAVTALSLFFIVLFLVFLFANLVMLPFNDILAEKTLQLKSALPEIQKGPKARGAKTLKNMGAMLRKLPILIVAGVIMTFAAFIPGLGIFAAAIGVFLMAVDRMDYASDHHQLSFKERIRFVRAHFWEVAGFAAALGFTTAIPFFNILLMPGSVVAGSLLFADLKSKKKGGSISASPLRNPTQIS
jgi:CysZ protein